MIFSRLHSRITRRLTKKYWSEPSVDFGSAFGGLQKDFQYNLAIDGYIDNAAKFTEFKKINLDVFPYELESQKFKLITCFGTIHYLTDPQKFLEELDRISTYDAVLIISVTNDTFLSNTWSFLLNIPSYHKKLNNEGFEKIVLSQNIWGIVEKDENISRSKFYFVLKKNQLK